MAKKKPDKKAEPKAEDGVKPIAKNRRAFHDYEVLEQIEAGLALKGSEVKSLREGQVSFQDAHARIDARGEAWLVDLHIAVYSHGGYANHEPGRARKLLLHRAEIRKIKQRLERQGLTMIPLEMYFRRGYAKVKLGVCRGKKLHDKRESLKLRADKRSMEREGRR